MTGIWNLADIDVADTSTSYQATVFIKVAVSVTAAVAVAIHSNGRSKLAVALGGAVGLLASLGAPFEGQPARPQRAVGDGEFVRASRELHDLLGAYR